MSQALDTALSYCTYCPKLCRHTCPVSNVEGRETVTPQAKMATFRLLRTETLPSSVEATSSLYACTGCGACTEACLHGITPGRHLMTGRADAQRAGDGHPALADLVDRVTRLAERSARRIAEIVRRSRRQPTDDALLPACTDPDGALAALALADRTVSGRDLGVVALPQGRLCGGYPLLAGGFVDAFRAHATELARALEGYRRVVVACPACAWAMKREYPAEGIALGPKVVHTTEYFAEIVEELPVARRRTGPLYYHDPCYLGRHLGVYDAPRELLRRADAEIAEFSRARGEAGCSGGGALLPVTMPETAEAIARDRLAEVREAGVKTVATACPTCRHRFEREGVVARDVIALLEEATR